MSKVVKSIGRAIGKVVKGAVKVVKKVAKSKLGKVIIGAAAIYFGGAALMGAVGSGSTVTGALANAWTQLGAAGSAAAAGNFGAAGSALANGISAGALGASASAPAIGATASAPTNAALAESAAMGGKATASGVTQVATAPALQSAAPAAESGWMKYGVPAAINAGTQAVAGYAQTKAAQAESEDERNRINANMSGNLFKKYAGRYEPSSFAGRFSG
jgi:hypothetical protein